MDRFRQVEIEAMSPELKNLSNIYNILQKKDKIHNILMANQGAIINSIFASPAMKLKGWRYSSLVC